MKKVLIIDDSIVARGLLYSIFSELGFEIVEAEDGMKGLEQFIKHQPDIVTLDITMPELDGYSTLDRIIEHDPAAKVIIVSSVGQNAAIIKCLELGAKEYIIKPFEEDMVIKKIKKIIPFK